MFDFIRKPLLWNAWEEGLDREIGQIKGFRLKSAQDLAVYAQLRGARRMQIAEIGSGYSRLLPALAKSNDCIAVEKFEGKGTGPTREHEIEGVRRVHAYLGENSPELPSASLDVVFSVSVVEHVAADGMRVLAAFHRDQLRILRPGGRFIHAIDEYLVDEPDQPTRQRFEAYRRWVADSPGVEPVGDVYDGPCRFSCDLVTNPDNVMHRWGQMEPSLDRLRQTAQCVSVLVAGRKL